ncbi:MAG TPA: discoidin domain-containing protein [Bacilli bacterium]
MLKHSALRIRLGMILFGLFCAVLAFPVSSSAVLTGSTSAGWNIFDPSGGGKYRYGPSMILNADNSIDMYTCSYGTVEEWDYIRYNRSLDGGATWGTESIVLKPTPGSVDKNSVCDPGIIKFGGYYYLGYTSTQNALGTDNDVFVARSTSKTGPWDKWNGSGWGGNPQPFITFDDPLTDMYGAGEPSFVVKDSTLYIYYTWSSRDPVTSRIIEQMRVRTASTSNANWPGATVYHGVAIHKGLSEDSADFKYVPSMNKFIAVSTALRMGPFAYIMMHESTDGITYKPATLPKNYINIAAHNAGITGNELGQYDTTMNNRIGYAYGTKWAHWYTAMNPFTLTNNNLPAVPRIQAIIPKNGQVVLHFRTTGITGETYKVNYGTVSGTYPNTITGITGSPYTVTGLTNGQPYYFTVTASNASGDSGGSLQSSAVPLGYSASPRLSVSVSSQLSGWEASKAIDSSFSSVWSSVNHDTSLATEWITVDTGANRMVKRVVLTPRLPEEFCYPGELKIQLSTDNTNWVNADIDIGHYRIEPNAQHVYEFNEPLYGRYVRLFSDRLGFDQYQPRIHYFQLSEIDIEQIPYVISASSTLSGWGATNALDGNNATSYSSVSSTSATTVQWLSLDVGATQPIQGVRLTPRTDGLGFPVDFKFQSSNDGVSWSDISGASYTAYPNPGSTTKTFKFNSTVNTRYLRLYATKLGSDNFGNYYLQMAEIKVDLLAKRTATSSSALSGWEVSKTVDNQTGTVYSSVSHTSSIATEWVAIDTGSVQSWSQLRIRPRNLYGFPQDFKIQSSNDGAAWSDIVGQSYTDYYNPEDTTQVFPFSSLVNTRYFRIYATKLSADDGGVYYLQLDDIIADR